MVGLSLRFSLEKALIKARIKCQANIKISPYEVDFVVVPYVVVEVDGYVHVLRDISERDRGKTLQLERLGYAVLEC